MNSRFNKQGNICFGLCGTEVIEQQSVVSERVESIRPGKTVNQLVYLPAGWSARLTCDYFIGKHVFES